MSNGLAVLNNRQSVQNLSKLFFHFVWRREKSFKERLNYIYVYIFPACNASPIVSTTQGQGKHSARVSFFFIVDDDD